ncbi:hypothetical protein [Spiroplasma endosymbiont of 'Nebria riversi']|uniref:hypothetical protein n=1 Tax=Spiroplasma endosymbiont of 'Nebria riversi' TaxID=2792084 RepID=UPI001C0412DE|nr:hypothetical protein [Spiroplasma endosymbiont of 'Nebria riversi']
MIYILIEHWVFNRVPVEFFVDATNNLNTSSTSYIASTLANNTQDMIPQRVTALDNFTELKNFLIPYNDENTVDANMIYLGLYYSKFVVDKLLENEKNERIDAINQEYAERIETDIKLSKAVHDEKVDRIVGGRLNDNFTLKKQLKFFQSRCQDYTCPQNPNLRGLITNLVIEEYASSDYEHETETLTVSFPKQIGTLPPNALQPNPQEGDYTHATTADFSAKLQKKINILTNNFKLLQNSFIGTIAWFGRVRDIEYGWFVLRTESYTVTLSDGSKIQTPALKEGDFIRNKTNDPLISENSNVVQHTHPINIIPDFEKPNSSFVFQNSENNFRALNRLHFVTVDNGDSYGCIFRSKSGFNDWPTVVSQYLHLFLKANTEKNETNILETRPQNTSLIAHIYVGLGAKIE